MAKKNNIEDRAMAWAMKWANFNHGAPDEQQTPIYTEKERQEASIRAALWIGFYTGGAKGWWRGYQAGKADSRRQSNG